MSAVLLLLLAQAAPIPLSEYRERLGRIDEAVARRDLEAVRSGARGLSALRVRHDGQDFDPDATVLGPLTGVVDLEAARVAAVRLKALREELAALEPGADAAAPDAALLERLRKEEAERRLSPDGQVGGPGLHAPDVPPSLRERILQLIRDLGELLERFLRWLLHFFEGERGKGSEAPSTRYLVGALIVTVLGVLGIIAAMALRRSKRIVVPGAVFEAPAMSAKDDDPLSRSASEWERFAAELMHAGRFREAIRAWYHAVLVSLFRSGLLHYRKDRTNWEYAHALSSALPWRPGFLDATRTFEQEWYGRRDTASEIAEVYQQQAQRMLDVVRGGGAR